MNSSNNQYAATFFKKKEAIIPKASYMKLQQNYSTSDNTLHIFVENNDDFEFYKPGITYVFRDYKTIPYSMEGKRNVIDGYLEIDWNKYKRHKILFFADKDYDDILNNTEVSSSNFFYTKYYSIENYLVNEDVFKIILDRFFTRMDLRVKNKLIEKFKFSYKIFVQQIKALTSFILIDRESAKKLDLDELKMTDFLLADSMNLFEIKLLKKDQYHSITRNPHKSSDLKKLIRKHTIKEILAKKCNGDINIFTFANVIKKRSLLNSITTSQIYTRGKYDFWFLYEMINTADKAIKSIYSEDSIEVTEQNPMPHKRTVINDTNIFDLLAPKIQIPHDVKYFLNLNHAMANGNN